MQLNSESKKLTYTVPSKSSFKAKEEINLSLPKLAFLLIKQWLIVGLGWFGARWIGDLRVPLSNNPFHFRGSNRNPNHRAPNQQGTISWPNLSTNNDFQNDASPFINLPPPNSFLYAHLSPRKLTCPLKRDYFSREYIFQPYNHWFSGDMLVFRWVSNLSPPQSPPT